MFRIFILVTVALSLSACGSGGTAHNPVNNDPDDGFSQCSDGLDNDGDGLIDYPEDPGCSSPDDNSEFHDGEVLGKAVAFFKITFVNSWEREIGQIIVMDGLHWPNTDLDDPQGNANLYWVAYQNHGEKYSPINGFLPGDERSVLFPVWGEYTTVIVRFIDEAGELTEWFHPLDRRTGTEEPGSYTAASATIFFPELFPAWTSWTYTVIEEGKDPFKG